MPAVIYSDINGEDFSQQQLVVNVESISQSLHNLFSTDRYERLFRPEYTADLLDLLFEPLDDVTAMELFDRIFDAVNRWEPRVRVQTGLSSVQVNAAQDGYDVTLYCELVGLDEPYVFRATLYREAA